MCCFFVRGCWYQLQHLKGLCEAENRGYTFVFHGWKQGEPSQLLPLHTELSRRVPFVTVLTYQVTCMLSHTHARIYILII